MSTVKTKVGAKEWARTTSVAVQAALPLLDPDVQRSLENLATQIEAILDILPVGTGVDNTVPRFVGTSGLIEPTALLISDTSFLSGVAGVGIGGASADATNRLSVNTPAVLFNRETDDIQVKLNKAAAGDTASFLFQTGFSGRAEIGTIGDDDFQFKTSPDGSVFTTGIRIAAADAAVSIPVSLMIPNGSAPTVNANGKIAVDTTVADFANGVFKYYAGIEMGAVAMPVAQFGSPLNGAVPTYNSTTDQFELVVDEGGDVVGPASSTDNAVARFDATTGKIIQNSTLILGDTGPLTPASNDGIALGTGVLAFSDLFLASGGVLDWANSNYTITHSSGLLTFSGGITATAGTVTLATLDMGSATSLRIPNSAAPTINANGEIAVDTTVADFSAGVLEYYSGEVMGVVAMPIAGFTSPTDGHIIAYNATNDEFELTPPTGISSIVAQTFTGSGTYTPTAGMVYCRICIQAPGGGSGGADGVGSGTGVSSGGGGGGEYVEAIATAVQIGASQTVTIGAVGTAGANTGTNGGTGGTTSLGTLLTAIGGTGGTGTGSNSIDDTPRAGGPGGTGGGGSLTATVRIPGQAGSDSLVQQSGSSVFPILAGEGGGSQMGRGARASAVNAWGAIATPGTAGQNYGSGASGAIAYSTTGQAGATGGPAIITIYEYIA